MIRSNPVSFVVTPDNDNKCYYYAMQIAALVEQARHDGVIITVENVPRMPLAMRNDDPLVEARRRP